MEIKINKKYQLLFDYAFGIKRTSIPKVRGLVNKLYTYLVSKHREDNKNSFFINYKMKDRTIVLNTTHSLPFTLRRHQIYSMNLVRLSKYVQTQKNNLKIIDIGANIGDTVFLISQEGNFPILCVEGNPEYLDLLKCNIAKYPNVEIEECFVGNEDKTESGKIVSDGLGTSFIKKETTDNVISYNSLATIISKHNDFADYNLLKIDTDGFDGEIIRGNIANIVKNKPVVFFEYAPTFFQNGIDSELVLFKILSENDYNKLIFYNNIGEMIFVFSLYDEIGIKFAHEYFSRGNRYADIIAFHDNDNNLFEYVLEEENKFLKDFYKS
jgi:FkbM family methyltransferase